MADTGIVAFNVASFICALFVLDFGADKFIDHTAIVARRTGVPQTVVALLIAGAEWEELAVVVFSIARHRPSLAIGNIIGSCISNILGAFSLGLLFHKNEHITFDRSSRLYSLLLLVVSFQTAGFLVLGHTLTWTALGAVNISLFAIYICSIAWLIHKGRIAPPELSDSDESDDSDVDEPQEIDPRTMTDDLRQQEEHSPRFTLRPNDSQSSNTDRQPLLGNGRTENTDSPAHVQPRSHERLFPRSPTSESSGSSTAGSKNRSLSYHVTLLAVGFAALTLSAYVISEAASTLATQFGISDVLFGIIILSIATTLPEKLVAVVSGSRGHTGIMVANTVGSNIFLLTLCMGILWTIAGGEMEDSVSPAEIGVMLGSTLLMTVTVLYGEPFARYTGGAMLAAYVAFIVLEFTVIRQV
ncbi:hypothetical protein Q7P37_003174 [Cladosporium fusiforme]